MKFQRILFSVYHSTILPSQYNRILLIRMDLYGFCSLEWNFKFFDKTISSYSNINSYYTFERDLIHTLRLRIVTTCNMQQFVTNTRVSREVESEPKAGSAVAVGPDLDLPMNVSIIRV